MLYQVQIFRWIKNLLIIAITTLKDSFRDGEFRKTLKENIKRMTYSKIFSFFLSSSSLILKVKRKERKSDRWVRWKTKNVKEEKEKQSINKK